MSTIVVFDGKIVNFTTHKRDFDEFEAQKLIELLLEVSKSVSVILL